MTKPTHTASKTLSTKLNTLMTARGHTAQSLQALTHFSLIDLKRWIAGSIPRSKKVRQGLADALGITYEELFSEVDRLKFLEVQEAGKRAQNIAVQKRNAAKEEKLRAALAATATEAHSSSSETQAKEPQKRGSYTSKIGRMKPPVNIWAHNAGPKKPGELDKPVCRRGQYYMLRMSSGVVVDRCCVGDRCVVRGE